MDSQQLHLFESPQVSSISESKRIGRKSQNEANTRNKAIRPKQRQEVLEAIQLAGANGLTSKEYASQTGSSLNRISGRFSELVAEGAIFRRDGDGAKRDGARVHWAKGFE